MLSFIFSLNQYLKDREIPSACIHNRMRWNKFCRIVLYGLFHNLAYGFTLNNSYEKIWESSFGWRAKCKLRKVKEEIVRIWLGNHLWPLSWIVWSWIFLHMASKLKWSELPESKGEGINVRLELWSYMLPCSSGPDSNSTWPSKRPSLSGKRLSTNI